MRLTGYAILPLLLACLLFPAMPSNAFDFLRISPSAAANGRGGIYLPGNWDDSHCAFYNPAGLGFAVMQQRFGVGFSDMKWLPGWDFVDMTYRSFGLYAPLGQDDGLKNLGYKGTIHYGVGLNGVLFDLGETERRDENNRPLGTFHSWESSYGLTIAAATISRVNTAFGVTLKGAHSEFLPGPEGDATALMFDFGGLLELPLLKILQRQHSNPPSMFGLNPEVTCGLGYAMSNVGGQVYYNYTDAGAPLPRTASISSGIVFELRKEDATFGTWRILSLGWGVQGDDDLICWKDDGGFHYSRSLRGDIRFFNDFLLGRFNPNIVKMRGWELGLIEAFYVRTGAYEAPEGNVFYHTYGFGLRLAGLYKCLVASGGYRPPEDLFRHIDIRYDFSRFDATPYRLGDPNPLDETKGHFVSFYFR